MKTMMGILAAMMIGAVGAVADITSGLVAHYEFEGNADDSKDNYPGLMTGNPTFVSGQIGQALSFDGVDDSFDTGIKPTEINNTYAFWFKANKTNYGSGYAAPIIEQWGGLGQSNASFSLYLKNDTLIFEAYTGTLHSASDPIPLNDNDWHQVILVLNVDYRKLVLDGNVVIDETLPGPQVSTQNTIMLGYTNVPYYVWKHFEGVIDDLKIYNRTLPEAEYEELSCNDRYDEGYTAGKAYCQSNPSACGISTGGTTVVASEDDISIDITSGWQLAGASGAIAVSDFSSFFDTDCVSEVYYFNNSWYHYVPGSSTSGLIPIGPDQGFWINGKKSCTLSNLRYTQEQCNLSYPSMSASDKAWCDAHYY